MSDTITLRFEGSPEKYELLRTLLEAEGFEIGINRNLTGTLERRDAGLAQLAIGYLLLDGFTDEIGREIARRVIRRFDELTGKGAKVELQEKTDASD